MLPYNSLHLNAFQSRSCILSRELLLLEHHHDVIEEA